MPKVSKVSKVSKISSMTKAYITVGCPTSGGGEVLTGSNFFHIQGKFVACVGDTASCPTHKVIATIVTGDSLMKVGGKAAAKAGDLLSCGCKLLPKQTLVVRADS